MSWITTPPDVSRDLASELHARTAARIAKGEFTDNDCRYISAVDFMPFKSGGLTLPDERLEKVRRLCQLWEVKALPPQITSHRPFIGPVIVAVKRLLFPIINAFLKDTLHQQRSFNAAATALVMELANEIEDRKAQ